MNVTKENARFYTFTEWKRGKTAREIHDALMEVWKQETPHYTTITRWVNDYAAERRDSFEDLGRSGRPISASGDDNTQIIRATVEANPHVSTREIENETGIPNKTVWRILTQKLEYHQIMSYWVPKLLSEEQKQNRINCARAIKETLMELGDDRYSRYVVEDETWVNFDEEYTHSSARVWVAKDANRPQIVASRLTPRKALVLIAVSANKRLSVRALPYGETLTHDGYIDFVKRTGDKWRCLRVNPIRLANVIWQHDNARPHAARDTQQFFISRKVTMLHQAPYSPDLNILDRWLNEKLKKELRQMKFCSAEEVESAVCDIVKKIDETVFRKEVDNLIRHCEEVLNAGGNYVTPHHS